MPSCLFETNGKPLTLDQPGIVIHISWMIVDDLPSDEKWFLGVYHLFAVVLLQHAPEQLSTQLRPWQISKNARNYSFLSFAWKYILSWSSSCFIQRISIYALSCELKVGIVLEETEYSLKPLIASFVEWHSMTSLLTIPITPGLWAIKCPTILFYKSSPCCTCSPYKYSL